MKTSCFGPRTPSLPGVNPCVSLGTVSTQETEGDEKRTTEPTRVECDRRRHDPSRERFDEPRSRRTMGKTMKQPHSRVYKETSEPLGTRWRSWEGPTPVLLTGFSHRDLEFLGRSKVVGETKESWDDSSVMVSEGHRPFQEKRRHDLGSTLLW